jgi:AcrR family transcriptional regulator
MTTSPPSDTRRNRRIERQRREIMDAAAQVFAQKGYAAATTRDIAEACDIGESTLYNYFEGKREILLAIIQHQAEQVDAVFLEFSRLETRQQMADIFVKVMDILLSQAHYTGALIGEAWFNDEIMTRFLSKRLAQISGYLEEYIRSRIQSGQFRPVNPSLAARMVIAVFMGFLLPALRGNELPPAGENRQRLAESVISLWLDGVERRP